MSRASNASARDSQSPGYRRCSRPDLAATAHSHAIHPSGSCFPFRYLATSDAGRNIHPKPSFATYPSENLHTKPLKLRHTPHPMVMSIISNLHLPPTIFEGTSYTFFNETIIHAAKRLWAAFAWRGVLFSSS